jgi:hypothetical protein
MFEMHSKAVEGLKKTLGSPQLQTLIAMENLVMSYLDCGQEFLDDAHNLIIKVHN